MQIKRLLNDREVSSLAGSKVIDAQGRPYTCVMDAAITPAHFITTFNRTGHQSLRYLASDTAS